MLLRPIYQLIFENVTREHCLALKKDEVVISYKTYKSTDPTDMQAIVDQKLAPGKTLDHKNNAQNLFQLHQ